MSTAERVEFNLEGVGGVMSELTITERENAERPELEKRTTGRWQKKRGESED